MELGFFLKKFVSFFIEPFGIVVALLVFGIYFFLYRKYFYSKVSSLLGVLLLLLFSYAPFASWLIAPLETHYTKFDSTQIPSLKDVAFIHVLGNGHTTDAMQPISSSLSSAGVKRVLEGVILQKNMPQTKLIFTGYKGDTNTSNAQMNARLAEALGVQKSQMIINAKPKDTKEEALFAKSLVGEKNFVLVTSASHMPRAIRLFESLGMHPIPAPTDFHKEEFVGYIRVPKPIYFHISTLAIHEYIGILWSRLRD